MEHLLFAGYIILFSWLVTKISFFKKSGLTPSVLVILFLIRVMAGIIYGWVGVYYGQMAQMVDTWAFHYESLEMHEVLKQDPATFFTRLFRNGYNGYGNFLASYNSWWNDLHNNSFIMLNSFFQLLSTGNYYINVIFFSFISFFAPIALYRVMLDLLPNRKLPVFLASFFLPSFLYWTSGIHKDGIVFMAFMFIIYHTYFGLKQGFTIRKYLMVILGLFILLVIRNFLFVIILPALIVWIIAARSKKPLFVFAGAYLLFMLLFFTARYIHPSLNFPEIVINKQADFKLLKGGSYVPTDDLEPNFTSFAKNAPAAFALSALRPYPSDVKHLLSLAASVEICLLLLCVVLFIFFRKRQEVNRPFILFCIFFSVPVLLSIGYTVNFLGAVVRYRSIVMPFLFVPLLALIHWRKLLSLILLKH